MTKLSKKERELVCLERLKATEAVASEIAHELNTPLGGILMYSHLLLEDLPDDDPIVENILKINKLAHRCKMIVQGLLDFVHDDEPKYELLQVNDIIHEVLGFLEDHVLLRAVRIEIRSGANLPKVRGVADKLEQVFVNLITNAAQSMDGRGTLRLQTTFEPKLDRIRITCSDTGCGIPEDQLEQVFEPFFTTKGEGVGMGLGLSICHGIVEQHGGTITVQSKPGKGTVFTILLPAGQDGRTK